MAAFFSKNGVRITPAGIIRGRDAIGRELQRVVIDLGLHDYSVRRTVSRLEGGMVSMPENGKPSSVTASSFAATIRPFWFVKAME